MTTSKAQAEGDGGEDWGGHDGLDCSAVGSVFLAGGGARDTLVEEDDIVLGGGTGGPAGGAGMEGEMSSSSVALFVCFTSVSGVGYLACGFG